MVNIQKNKKSLSVLFSFLMTVRRSSNILVSLPIYIKYHMVWSHCQQYHTNQFKNNHSFCAYPINLYYFPFFFRLFLSSFTSISKLQSKFRTKNFTTYFSKQLLQISSNRKETMHESTTVSRTKLNKSIKYNCQEHKDPDNVP